MTMIPRIRAGLAAAFALGLLWSLAASPVAAQGRREGPPSRAEMERRVRERFEAIVNRELGLSEAQGDELRRIVMDFQPERRALGRRSMQLRQELSAADASLDDVRARALLDELVQVQEAEARILRQEIERMLTVLTPAQAVRFYTLRERMGERMRQLQDRVGGPAGRGGPGGGRPGG